VRQIGLGWAERKGWVVRVRVLPPGPILGVGPAAHVTRTDQTCAGTRALHWLGAVTVQQSQSLGPNISITFWSAPTSPSRNVGSLSALMGWKLLRLSAPLTRGYCSEKASGALAPTADSGSLPRDLPFGECADGVLFLSWERFDSDCRVRHPFLGGGDYQEKRRGQRLPFSADR